MAKKGDKYILSPAEEQLLNDPKAGNIVKSGGKVKFDSLPLDLQRQLGAVLSESGINDPSGNDISLSNGVLNQVNGLDAIQQKLATQLAPSPLAPAVSPASGSPVIPNGSIIPTKPNQNKLFAGAADGDTREGSPVVNDIKGLLNKLRNQYITPGIRQHPVLGPIDSVISAIDDFHKGNIDKQDIGVGPINARNISDVVKGAKNAIGGNTAEQNVIAELQKRFPGLDIKSEITKARQGNKQNAVAAQEGRTASGKRWRIMPDGSIRIIG